jgi:uncharacterized membrane protein
MWKHIWMFCVLNYFLIAFLKKKLKKKEKERKYQKTKVNNRMTIQLNFVCKVNDLNLPIMFKRNGLCIIVVYMLCKSVCT